MNTVIKTDEQTDPEAVLRALKNGPLPANTLEDRLPGPRVARRLSVDKALDQGTIIWAECLSRGRHFARAGSDLGTILAVGGTKKALDTCTYNLSSTAAIKAKQDEAKAERQERADEQAEIRASVERDRYQLKITRLLETLAAEWSKQDEYLDQVFRHKADRRKLSEEFQQRELVDRAHTKRAFFQREFRKKMGQYPEPELLDNIAPVPDKVVS